MRILSRIFLGSILLARFCTPASAAVALDGSVGAKGALTGPHFSLDATKGKRVGSNLFYSFSDFSLNKGDVASFSSHTAVKNVLARVTGGNPSNIDGTIQVTIPNANFYLMNPAGVIFGPDAKLDVKGSFAVTTANQIKLADGGHFDAQLPETSLLTTAAPAAFGFLGKPAAISISGATLAVSTGNRVILAGGDLNAGSAVLLAPAGQVSVTSTASAGDVAIAGDLTPASAASGKIVLDHAALVTNGASGGRIDIHAGTLSMNRSLLAAGTTGDQPGRGIDLTLSGNLSADNSLIDASTNNTGTGGSITITAADISMTAQRSNRHRQRHSKSVAGFGRGRQHRKSHDHRLLHPSGRRRTVRCLNQRHGQRGEHSCQRRHDRSGRNRGRRKRAGWHLGKHIRPGRRCRRQRQHRC